ncbi:MAG: endonuclease III domain-containing protein [Chloroflexota bacterium]
MLEIASALSYLAIAKKASPLCIKRRRHDIFDLVAIEEFIELLEQEYGPRKWQPDRDPIDVLIGTILSQNTSDANSGRAFASLKASFDSWETVASTPAEHIARVIQFGGLSQIKAVRIKQVLEQIEKEQGRISLDSLKAMNMAEAEDYLMRLPGVGNKTASCVLLFSLGKPSLPVDTHVFRVAKRLGLIDSRVSLEKAHSLLQKQIPPSKIYQFHIHMIEHGRRICHARQPRCNRCILRSICPSSLC